MKPKLFPKEIIAYSAESHFSNFTVRSQVIYLTVLIFIVFSLLCLPFIFVDVSVQSSGLVRPLTYKSIITAPVSGRVKAVYMEDNLPVKDNQTLIVLEAELIEEQIVTNSNRIIKVENFIRDLKRLAIIIKDTALEEVNSFKTSLYALSYLHFQQQLSDAKNQYGKVKKEFDRNKLLYEEKVIAQVDFDNIEFDLKQSIIAINTLEKAQASKWQAELNNYQQELAELEAENRRLQKEKERYIIRSPLSGTIQSFSGIYNGSFIYANQEIAEVSPDSELIVECYITPADIGLLKEGTPARFQIDAFNYNEWGMITGKIIEISNDIIVTDGKPFFKIKCSLDEKSLKLKNGYVGTMKKGMTLQARFLITQRSLFQLLYDKVDDWVNPNRANIETASL